MVDSTADSSQLPRLPLISKETLTTYCRVGGDPFRNTLTKQLEDFMTRLDVENPVLFSMIRSYEKKLSQILEENEVEPADATVASVFLISTGMCMYELLESQLQADYLNRKFNLNQ